VIDVSVSAVRARFQALDVPLAFFDAPGGTQCPDSVREAIDTYLLTANANRGGPFATSRATERVVAGARVAAAGFLGCEEREVVFGANMTTLNFALSRTAARSWSAGDEIIVTRLDHDANISPWLELAHDRGFIVRFCELDRECRLDLAHLRELLSARTRVVAFPWASNAVGTVTPAAEIVALAHAAGALAWVDAVHYAPHAEISVHELGGDVLLCSPYKFFGPHLGIACVRLDLLEGWRPYKVRPAHDHGGERLETGTLPHELLCGLVAALDYLGEVGWGFIATHERELGQRFLDGLPADWRLHGPPTMAARVPTFSLSPPDERPAEAAARLAEAGFAVWHGDYYAIEVMRHLGLPEGAVRIGIVHTNTREELDGLLAALPRCRA
jgi:cysteine desulfurase family protein (TIGR01976 family)